MADSPSSLEDFAARHGLDPEALAELSALIDTAPGGAWQTRDWAASFWEYAGPADKRDGEGAGEP